MKPTAHINQITFNDGQTISFDPNDIVIFTGANNSGKSQVLKDINSLSNASTNNKIVLDSLSTIRTGDIEEIKRLLTKEKNGHYYFRGNHIGVNLPQSWAEISQCLGNFSHFFVNHLTTEQRLGAAQPPEPFNVLSEQPTHPIQALYANNTKEKEISDYFKIAFGSELIINRGAGNTIPMHMGSKPIIEAGEDRVSTSYLAKLQERPLLQNQGDGMRSFAGILLNVFTSQQTITLIDEPEAFLHPPQARLLGKMLANNKPNNRQLFISTHSEDFLKGLLDANNNNVKIIRINREDNVNHMSILNDEQIKNIWKDPLLRYSNILSGLFHSKVVVCEADTDCLFYQAVMNSLYDDENEVSPDILFTHCGGKQRLHMVIRALKALNVRVVAVADFDILKDRREFETITTTLGISWGELVTPWRIIKEYIDSQRPQLNKIEVEKEITTILAEVNNDILPKEDADKIKKVIKSATAWSKVKEVGKLFLSGDSVNAYDEIEAKCKSVGLMIVPVGELERFYPQVSDHGTRWVNTVLETVDLESEPRLKSAREFVKQIVNF